MLTAVETEFSDEKTKSSRPTGGYEHDIPEREKGRYGWNVAQEGDRWQGKGREQLKAFMALVCPAELIFSNIQSHYTYRKL